MIIWVNVIQQIKVIVLLLSVESRLSELSSDKNVFIQAASIYKKALKQAGYNDKPSYNNSDKYNSNNNINSINNNNKVKFNSNDNGGNNNNNNYRNNIKNQVNTTITTTAINNNNNNNNNDDDNNNKSININDNNNNPQTSKQRKRNIIWLNPRFSKKVATKIGRYFLNLIDNHFPRDHKLHKMFNRNNTKVSYSCIPNIKSPINSHNRKVHLPLINSQSRTCNCIKKTDCLYKRNA